MSADCLQPAQPIAIAQKAFNTAPVRCSGLDKLLWLYKKWASGRWLKGATIPAPVTSTDADHDSC